MKKILVAAAVAAVFASASFADGITFGSWGRGLWIGAANEGKDNIVTAFNQSWGGNSPRTALSVHGSSENMGFDLDIFADGNTGLGVGDNARIWWKPVEQVFAQMGCVDYNPLRGDAAYGLWDFQRIGAVTDEEGWTFFGQSAKPGMVLTVTPVEGLTVVGRVNMASYNAGTGATVGATYTIQDAFGLHSGAYVAYAIPDIGTVKLGVEADGDKKAAEFKDGILKDPKHWVTAGVAFDLTAVENLFVSVGAFIPTSDGWTATGAKNNYRANAYARYSMDPITVHVRAGSKIGVYDAGETTKKGKLVDDAVGFLVGGAVDFKLDDFADALANTKAFIEADYANGVYLNGSSADNMDTLTFGVGLVKGYSNGQVGIAFEGTTNNKGVYTLDKADKFGWCVPIQFQYSF